MKVTLHLIILFVAISVFSVFLPLAHADSTINIVNVQTVESNDQSCFYFIRGVDVVGFNVSVTNDGSSINSGQLTITMFDTNQVLIECFQSQVFSVNPGETKMIQIISGIIPVFAYVGPASAQVVLSDPSGQSIDFKNVNYYIGSTNWELISSITVTPSEATVAAGSSVNYSAIAYDVFGNTLDVSSGVNWAVNNGAGGSWLGNVYSSANVGVWTVTGSSGAYTGSALLNVTRALGISVSVSPLTANVVAGSNQTLTATASDIYGNTWDVTNAASWSVSPGAGGSWLNSTFASATSGTWVVTGTYDGISGTANITVSNGSPVKLILGSTNSLVTAGSNVTFSSTAMDNCGNSWDVSASTVWSVSSGAGGFFVDNVYSATEAGTWIITGTLGGLSIHKLNCQPWLSNFDCD